MTVSSKSKVQSSKFKAEKHSSSFEPETLNFELVVRDLCKSFRLPSGDVLHVLGGVSFSVAVGEMVAITGSSGTGKSTLLHVLGGLEAADGGSVRLGDFDITRATVAEMARFRNHQLGFVFQSHRLLLDLTAMENVALPLRIARRSFAEAQAAAQLSLERVGLKERAAQHVGELSGGEQQRVSIARAIVANPQLVLADEPTGNLDARTGAEVGALLLFLCRARSLSVIIATHNEDLARTCDRVLRLQGGQLRET